MGIREESESSFKILDEDYEEFDASFRISKPGDYWSLIIESAGGLRYRDYRYALDAILDRFKENEAVLVDATLESKNFLEKPIEERRIGIQLPVPLKEVQDISDFRLKITKKASHIFGGGNNTERCLGFKFELPLNLDQENLISVLRFPTYSVISGDEAGVFESLTEGAKKTIQVNAYERDPKARKLCLEKYGYSCSVCGFDFQENYGDIGKNYIHVHHLTELSLLGEEHEVDPIEDLRPLCPNCHAMIHKQRPAFSIEELQEIMHRKKKMAVSPLWRKIAVRLKVVKPESPSL